MAKQVLLPILGVIIFIVAVGIFVQKSATLNLSGLISPTPTPNNSEVKIGDTNVQVKLAKTKEDRTKGLAGVTSLETNSGMLFIFNPKANPTFWMKDMAIPLDIIWISDGKIVKIDKSVPVPAPGTEDKNLKAYSPGQLIDYVLEVNAGFSNKNNIKVGDSVDFSKI